jgi:hypothetical protein
VPADQSIPRSGPRLQPGTLRSVGRRRPSGEPPPLPHHLQISGVGWLIAAVALIALVVAAFGGGMRGPAVALTVADDAVVRWLAGLEAPGLAAVKRALAALSSWWVLNGLLAGLVLALLALRRFRHLIVFLIFANVVVLFAGNMVGAIARRPRPFGVAIQTSWGGWALPSLQVTFFAMVLVAILYTLAPQGRWRNTGKWVAVALVALTGLGRIALGADAPTGVLVGAAIGVTIPLLAFRWFTPSRVFPVTYRRGRSAHLDVGGARGQAIRRAMQDQLDLAVQDIKPFGLAGSAGSTPLRITIKGDPPTTLFGKLYARSHLRADRWYKLGRELLYGRLEDEKPFNTVRRLVQQEDYALRLCRDARLPSPKPYGFVELTPEREYLLVTEFFAGATELGEAEADDEVIDDGLGIVRRLWTTGLAHPRHQAGQPAGAGRPAAADRRGLRGGPPQPLAAGGGPGQHDAVFGAALQPGAGLPAGRAAVQRGGDQRGVRGCPGVGAALSAAPAAAGAGSRPARRVHPAAARPTASGLDPAVERSPDWTLGTDGGVAGGAWRPNHQVLAQ